MNFVQLESSHRLKKRIESYFRFVTQDFPFTCLAKRNQSIIIYVYIYLLPSYFICKIPYARVHARKNMRNKHFPTPKELTWTCTIDKETWKRKKKKKANILIFISTEEPLSSGMYIYIYIESQKLTLNVNLRNHSGNSPFMFIT